MDNKSNIDPWCTGAIYSIAAYNVCLVCTPVQTPLSWRDIKEIHEQNARLKENAEDSAEAWTQMWWAGRLGEGLGWMRNNRGPRGEGKAVIFIERGRGCIGNVSHCIPKLGDPLQISVRTMYYTLGVFPIYTWDGRLSTWSEHRTLHITVMRYNFLLLTW